jgi:hypothetical protein
MINLLPPNLISNKGIFKQAKAIRSLTLVAIIVFLVFGLGVGGLILLGSSQLSSLIAQNNALKESIRERETTEQKMVLLKDRVGKIKIVKNLESSEEEIVGVTALLTTISAPSVVSELTFDAKKVDLSLIFKAPSDLSAFLRSLVNNKVFDSVVLTSFGFNPSNGYILSLRLSKNI